MLQAILQASNSTTVTIAIPSSVWNYIVAFIIALGIGFQGYVSGTGDGLPIQWNSLLFIKTVAIALLVAYAQVYLGMTQSGAETWASATFAVLWTLGADKAVNMAIKAANNRPPTQPVGLQESAQSAS